MYDVGHCTAVLYVYLQQPSTPITIATLTAAAKATITATSSKIMQTNIRHNDCNNSNNCNDNINNRSSDVQHYRLESSLIVVLSRCHQGRSLPPISGLFICSHTLQRNSHVFVVTKFCQFSELYYIPCPFNRSCY